MDNRKSEHWMAVPHWDNMSRAWYGHQLLPAGQNIISKMNSSAATCKKELTVFPWWKGSPFLLSKHCHPEQCQIKERQNNTIPMNTEVLRNRFSDFPNPTSRGCEWANGAVPRYTSITWCAQYSSRQLVSWERSLNCPECSDNKEDILVAGKGRIGRQSPWHHAAMPRWQDDPQLSLKRVIHSEIASHLSYTFLQPRYCLIKLLQYTCIEMIWVIIKRLT